MSKLFIENVNSMIKGTKPGTRPKLKRQSSTSSSSSSDAQTSNIKARRPETKYISSASSDTSEPTIKPKKKSSGYSQPFSYIYEQQNITQSQLVREASQNAEKFNKPKQLPIKSVDYPTKRKSSSSSDSSISPRKSDSIIKKATNWLNKTSKASSSSESDSNIDTQRVKVPNVKIDKPSLPGVEWPKIDKSNFKIEAPSFKAKIRGPKLQKKSGSSSSSSSDLEEDKALALNTPKVKIANIRGTTSDLNQMVPDMNVKKPKFGTNRKSSSSTSSDSDEQKQDLPGTKISKVKVPKVSAPETKIPTTKIENPKPKVDKPSVEGKIPSSDQQVSDIKVKKPKFGFKMPTFGKKSTNSSSSSSSSEDERKLEVSSPGMKIPKVKASKPTAPNIQIQKAKISRSSSSSSSSSSDSESDLHLHGKVPGMKLPKIKVPDLTNSSVTIDKPSFNGINRKSSSSSSSSSSNSNIDKKDLVTITRTAHIPTYSSNLKQSSLSSMDEPVRKSMKPLPTLVASQLPRDTEDWPTMVKNVKPNNTPILDSRPVRSDQFTSKSNYVESVKYIDSGKLCHVL